MTEYAAAMIAFVDQLADAAECEFWGCAEMGAHHDSCLTDCDAEGNRCIPEVTR